MSRVRFAKGKQQKFFRDVRNRSGLSVEKLASLCDVSSRTFRDWCREKYTPRYKAVVSLGKRFNISFVGAREVDDYWYVERAARLGCRKRNKLYGPPGSIGSRRKGGLVSQRRRRENPELYRDMGCNVRKSFRIPSPSIELAEAFGIIMGDGSITDYQVSVTLNRIVDREYAFFVRHLMGEIFGEVPVWTERANVIDLRLSGAGLVEMLEAKGLKRGDKVRNQIGFPKWILRSRKYRIACARGLFDTDGGLYLHKKKSGTYVGWCFANRSKPLIHGMLKVLEECQLKASVVGEDKLFMYHSESIRRYMETVGSHNPKNAKKFGGFA